WRGRMLGALGAAALVADGLRLGGAVGSPATGLVGSACVWLFCHQLGYFWRDGTLVAGGRGRALRLAAGGLAALAGLTLVGPYPSSMVAVRGGAVSNMFPTTACIAALATLQLGLVLLARPGLERWLQRRSAWRTVVAANGVAMPVFCWHMTALVAFLWAYDRAGFALATSSSSDWWLTRPVWIAGPGALLGGGLLLAARAGRLAPHAPVGALDRRRTGTSVDR
ncbi:MAG TPA: hypothetical protein VJM49_09680, partial [Acidimicrobiales bacterium]|nr:hypothetical protein [Acidimicrobiales bacterium]